MKDLNKIEGLLTERTKYNQIPSYQELRYINVNEKKATTGTGKARAAMNRNWAYLAEGPLRT